MNPKEYKGKTVTHTPTAKTFVVAGGGKNKTTKAWFLKDEQGVTYPLTECQLIESQSQINQLEFDTRKIRDAKDLQAIAKYYDRIGSDRFLAACQNLDQIEAAVLGVFYCENWEQFCAVAEGYGVTKERCLQLNERFRNRLKEKGLAGQVAQWYQEHNQGKAA